MVRILIAGFLGLTFMISAYPQQKSLFGLPIEPGTLHENGKLNVPFADEDFDPANEWEQTWRIWMPGRGKSNSSSGYLKVNKTIDSSNKLHFLVTQVISEDHSWVHSTLAEIRAENNSFATPLEWIKSTRFHTSPASGSKHLSELDGYHKGSIEDLNLDEGAGAATSFTLFDAIQRMHAAGLNTLEFTLLDELDKAKRSHVIKYKEESSIGFAGKERAVSVYFEKGEGSLPWMYYVDENSRLLLAISGMRAYILDQGCEREYQDIFSHPLTALDEKEKNQEISVDRKPNKKPNILFLTTDQQVWESISQLGNSYLHTPNLDRLARDGCSFYESYSPNPVCSPARATWLTGLTPSENGVITNGLPIIEHIETVADKLSEGGYETVFAGKLHVGIPSSYQQQIPGFSRVLCEGIGGKGTLGDQVVSSVVEGYLQNRNTEKPFFAAVHFLQPHDICNWITRFSIDNSNPFADLVDQKELPPLPENHLALMNEPVNMDSKKKKEWNEKDWRYYLWSYYRMIEEVDAEIGRVLRAVDDAGETGNTVIIFNSDHGEGAAHHESVLKNNFYDEACRVPFMISYPGEIKSGVTDSCHLVSGLDIVPTICDFAGVEKPANAKGLSVRNIASGASADWRDFIVAEVNHDQGRMVRSSKYKLIAFRDDPEILFFDMKNDPGETTNLANDSGYEHALMKHIRMLERWEDKLVSAPNAKGSFKVFLQ